MILQTYSDNSYDCKYIVAKEKHINYGLKEKPISYILNNERN